MKSIALIFSLFTFSFFTWFTPPKPEPVKEIGISRVQFQDSLQHQIDRCVRRLEQRIDSDAIEAQKLAQECRSITF